MGGRGGGSGRGGGGGMAVRGKTDHLADDYVGYSEAIDMLMKETGLSREQAEIAQSALNDYFGSGYSNIRNGHPPSAAEKAKVIDNALKKARPYSGEIYRGIHLDNETFAEWSKGLQKGATIDMKGVSSWSSRKTVAESFAKGGAPNTQSIIFKVKSTKHAAPVQHLSHYGKGEAEVLAPSFAKYKIKGFTTQGNTTYIDLAEVG